MTVELMPCPFCGCAEVTLWPMGKFQSPLCESCGATVEEAVTGENTKAQITAWNRRAPSARIAALEAERDALVISGPSPEQFNLVRRVLDGRCDDSDKAVSLLSLKLKGALSALRKAMAENRKNSERASSLEAELLALKKAYQAHRDTKHHLAECVKCRKGMTALCSEWERLECDVCGKLDYAMDKAAERERDALKREGQRG